MMLFLAPLGKNCEPYEKSVLQAIGMIILQQKLSSSFVFVELAVYIQGSDYGFAWFYYQDWLGWSQVPAVSLD